MNRTLVYRDLKKLKLGEPKIEIRKIEESTSRSEEIRTKENRDGGKLRENWKENWNPKKWRIEVLQDVDVHVEMLHNLLHDGNINAKGAKTIHVRIDKNKKDASKSERHKHSGIVHEQTQLLHEIVLRQIEDKIPPDTAYCTLHTNALRREPTNEQEWIQKAAHAWRHKRKRIQSTNKLEKIHNRTKRTAPRDCTSTCQGVGSTGLVFTKLRSSSWTLAERTKENMNSGTVHENELIRKRQTAWQAKHRKHQ